MTRTRFLFVAFLSVLESCARAPQREASREKPPEAVAPRENWRSVRVSHYGRGDGFAGKKTASGEKFNPEAMTAAHRTLPFRTRIRLRNPENGKTVDLRINDRGPRVKGREFDISSAAARQLGITKDGVSRLDVLMVDDSAPEKESGTDR